TATSIELSTSQQTVDAMLRALNKASSPSDDLYKRLNTAKNTLLGIEKELQGDKIKGEIGERSNPTASDGSSIGWRALGNTYGPTDEHKGFLSRVENQLKTVKAKLLPFVNSTLPALESDLKKTGAPWVEGQGLIKN
ncbi:MAG: glycosyl hydrolase, partial [Maribacter sp.]